MGNNRENVNKVTILCVSGKKKDKEEFLYRVMDRVGPTERYICNKTTKSKKLIARIINKQNISGWYLRWCDVIILEDLNDNIIKDIGDELDNMILDIRFNKYNKKVASQQIQEIIELLEKL